jgi:uncharacterized protein (DUF58 family)
VIPEHLAHELRYIELRAARRTRHLRVGDYTSPLRGEGFEFDQHTPYRTGDDVRQIDWNATARLGVPFLRQTRSERELHMVLAGDLSRSMEFGSQARSKHDALVLATASLLFSALANQISSGVLGFADRVLEWTAPVTDKPTAWAALTRLWEIRRSRKRTLLQPAVQHLLRVLRRTTLVVIVSDFLTGDDFSSFPELALLAARHDVVAAVLEDPAEIMLPHGAGYVRLRDVESDAEITVGLTNDIRRLYAASVERRRDELRRLFYTCAIEHVFVNTQDDVIEPLMRVFDRRKS